MFDVCAGVHTEARGGCLMPGGGSLAEPEA